MSTTRSDTRKNSTATHNTTVREYLRSHDEVASKADARAARPCRRDTSTRSPRQRHSIPLSTTTTSTLPASTSSATEPPTTASGDQRWMTALPSSTAKKTPNRRSSHSRFSVPLDSLQPRRPTLLPAAQNARREPRDSRGEPVRCNRLHPPLAVPEGRPADTA